MRACGLAIFLIASGALSAQDRAPQDRAIDRLLAGPERNDIRWTVNIPQPALSAFQRLWTRISIRVDGKEIAKRDGKGEFLFTAEFKDAGNRAYRTQKRVDLAEYHNATSSHELECAVQIFILPGNYSVSLAVVEPASEKFSLTHRSLHVPPVGGDPLPDLWRGLHAVDFVDVPDAPDDWFLPDEHGRLFLAAQTRRPIRLELLANITPSETSHRQGRTYNRNMDAIIPSLKILSALELRGGSKDVAVLDVARRRVAYEQHDVRRLDWAALKPALEADNPNKIDAAALKDRDQNARFFVAQAVRRATPAGAVQPLLVVLTGPLMFTSHQEIDPVDAPPGARVFYLRFQSIFPAAVAPGPSAMARGRAPLGEPGITAPRVLGDDLERTLKPLQPRLFDIYSPMDFRKALAAILHEIAR